MEGVLNCPVCLDSFDNATHIPRSLPCGHTLCTICAQALLPNNSEIFSNLEASSSPRLPQCPECRGNIGTLSALELPICYTLVRLINSIDSENSDRTKLPQVSNGNSVVGLRHKIREEIIKQELVVSDKMRSLTNTIDKTVEEVNIYKRQISKLSNWLESIKVCECTCTCSKDPEDKVESKSTEIHSDNITSNINDENEVSASTEPPLTTTPLKSVTRRKKSTKSSNRLTMNYVDESVTVHQNFQARSEEIYQEYIQVIYAIGFIILLLTTISFENFYLEVISQLNLTNN